MTFSIAEVRSSVKLSYRLYIDIRNARFLSAWHLDMYRMLKTLDIVVSVRPLHNSIEVRLQMSLDERSFTSARVYERRCRLDLNNFGAIERRLGPIWPSDIRWIPVDSSNFILYSADAYCAIRCDIISWHPKSPHTLDSRTKIAPQKIIYHIQIYKRNLLDLVHTPITFSHQILLRRIQRYVVGASCSVPLPVCLLIWLG